MATAKSGGKLYVEGKISNTHYDPRWFEKLNSDGKFMFKMAVDTHINDFDGYLKVLGMTPECGLRDVLEQFYDNTPIALELPYYSFILHLSAWLAEKNISVDIGGQEVRPYLWFILLAKSRGFKSFSNSIITDSAPTKQNIEGFESDAKFIEMLYDNQSKEVKNFVMIDEFAQVLKKIEKDGSPLAGCKQYFLLSYDAATGRKEISRKTKTNEIVVNDPAMNFLGINVYETFLQSLSQESCSDGFFQRFSCVMASDTKKEKIPRDPRAGKYTKINKEPIRNALNNLWNDITSQFLFEKYEVKDEVFKIFEEISDKFNTRYPSVPDSFFIRERFKLFTYALIFHILRGKGADKYIDRIDAKYAALMFEKSLDNISQILRDMNPDNVFDKVKRLIEIRRNFEEKQNNLQENQRKRFAIRDAIAGFAGKVKSNEAKELWYLAFDDEPEIKRKR